MPASPSLFALWNAALLRSFFSPAQKDEMVFLAVSRDEIDALAPELGGYEGLVAVVRDGPHDRRAFPDYGPTRPLEVWATGLRRQREQRRPRPSTYEEPSLLLSYGTPDDRMPPYLPILAVLVASFSARVPGGFYNHVRERLDLPHWSPNEHQQITMLWDDLSHWTSSAETNGRYGRFLPVRFGQHRFVSYLRAQGVILRTDFPRLFCVFQDHGLAPGQGLQGQRLDDVLTTIAAEHRFSTGLREAAQTPEYRDMLGLRLTQILDDWDGQCHRATTETHGGGGSHSDRAPGQAERDALVTLHLTDDSLPWRVGWRLRDLPDVGILELKDDKNRRWKAICGGETEVTAEPVGLNPDMAAILDEVRQADRLGIKLSIVQDPNLEVEFRLSGVFTIRHRPLRCLVYRDAERCLVERDDLPQHGPAYLLCSPENQNFDSIIYLHEVRLTPCPDIGLPSGWRLFLLPDCAELTEEARRMLSGESAERGQSRTLKLVGGLRLNRDGRVLFLPYDLPSIELDAPEGSWPQAEGLSLIREQGFGNPALNLRVTQVRQYRLRPEDDSRQHFVIEAKNAEGWPIARATLRIASLETPRISEGGSAGLDPAGCSTSTLPLVSGVILKGSASYQGSQSGQHVAAAALGSPLDDDWLASRLPRTAEAQFLDALTQRSAGTLRYGDARDLMQRLLRESDRREPVARLLRALRRRGHLEIMTDSRGRWSAVASVPPTLHLLPVRTDERRVWGVSGTLSLVQWSALRQLGAELRWENDPSSRLRVLRIIGSVEDAPPSVFRVDHRPCTSIAEFSQSLAERRAAMARSGLEMSPYQLDHREAFTPLSMEWVHQPRPDEWVLMRHTDPETGIHQLHSLCSRRDGRQLLHHVRDERWGIWIALASCIESLARAGVCDHLEAWPLHYDRVAQTIWLPARMSLPLVLERALVAASGGPPVEVSLIRGVDSHDGAILATNEFGSNVGTFHPCYDPLLPDGEARLWLQYRWVPPELAHVVADKLSSKLVEFPFNPNEGET